MSHSPAYESEIISAYKYLPSLAFPEDLPLPCLGAADKEISEEEPTANLFHTSMSIKMDAARFLAGQGLEAHANELLGKAGQAALACEKLIDEAYTDARDYVTDQCYTGILRNTVHYYQQPGALTEGQTVDTRFQASAYSAITREIVTPLIEMGPSDEAEVRSAMATQRNKLVVMQLLNRMQQHDPSTLWAIVGANKREQHCDLRQDHSRQSNNFNLKIMLDGGDFIPLSIWGYSSAGYEYGMLPPDDRIGSISVSEICNIPELWSVLRAMHFDVNGMKLYADQAELIRGATSRLMDQLVSLRPVQKTAPDTERSQRGIAAFRTLLEQGRNASMY